MVDCRLKKNKKVSRCVLLRSVLNKPKTSYNWKESKAKFPKLSPCGDVDKDRVKNRKDCRPFNKKRQDVESQALPYFGDELYVCPRIIKAVDIIRYGKELGLKPTETHQELQEKGYTGDEERNAMRLFKQNQLGLNLISSEKGC